jgi:hypothetical protein
MLLNYLITYNIFLYFCLGFSIIYFKDYYYDENDDYYYDNNESKNIEEYDDNYYDEAYEIYDYDDYDDGDDYDD